ncbi:MAG: acetate/propionate family kinase [Pseudomonadota bacterium]
MHPPVPGILCLNGGSSSLKFAVYRMDSGERCVARGKVERIGADAACHFDFPGEETGTHTGTPPKNHAAALAVILDKLEAAGVTFNAVGHRVVHGGQFTESQRASDEVTTGLQRIAPFDPEHMPAALAGIQQLAEARPEIEQVLCFDTVFHRSMPAVARTFPIPFEYRESGLQRYGFHGISYQYLVEELARVAPDESDQRVVLAHLGNGASMAAVQAGRCVDTTMGFTPTGGLIMGTRSGDLDPGVLLFLMEREGLSIDQLTKLVNSQSGLHAVSGGVSDVRDLLACEQTNADAALAIEMFCHSAAKHLAAMSASLGGLESIVFSGGIGEHEPVIRRRICERLVHLGVVLDVKANAQNSAVISAADSAVNVRVIATNEELMIARFTARLLAT